MQLEVYAPLAHGLRDTLAVQTANDQYIGLCLRKLLFLASKARLLAVMRCVSLSMNAGVSRDAKEAMGGRKMKAT